MGAKLSGSDEGPISEINIVPFVDIILVVLIIFMVTTPLIMKPSISVNLPDAVSGEQTTPSKFNITITSSGQVMLNGKVSSIKDINERAKEVSSVNPAAQAIISADKAVSHGDVVSVIDAVKSAGIKKFAITIEKN